MSDDFSVFIIISRRIIFNQSYRGNITGRSIFQKKNFKKFLKSVKPKSEKKKFWFRVLLLDHSAAYLVVTEIVQNNASLIK